MATNYKLTKSEVDNLMQMVFRATVDALKRKDHLKDDPEFIMSKYKLIITEHPIGNHSIPLDLHKTGFFSTNGEKEGEECITFVEIV